MQQSSCTIDGGAVSSDVDAGLIVEEWMITPPVVSYHRVFAAPDPDPSHLGHLGAWPYRSKSNKYRGNVTVASHELLDAVRTRYRCETRGW